MPTQLIRPGFLVALKTQVRGGVHYDRRDLPVDEANAERWETLKRVDDPEELERASKVRSTAGNLIRGMCAATSFGLLCPKDNELRLDAAVFKAKQLVAEFNATAKYTQISVGVLKGRVADNDVEAIGSIMGEVADLLRQMEDGIKTLDVQAMRQAANRARAAASMLGEEQKAIAENAIAAARKVARELVKRTAQLGEESQEAIVAGIDTSVISTARIQFLDLAHEAEADAEAERQTLGRFVDLDADTEAGAAAAAAEQSEEGQPVPDDADREVW